MAEGEDLVLLEPEPEQGEKAVADVVKGGGGLGEGGEPDELHLGKWRIGDRVFTYVNGPPYDEQKPYGELWYSSSFELLFLRRSGGAVTEEEFRRIACDPTLYALLGSPLFFELYEGDVRVIRHLGRVYEPPDTADSYDRGARIYVGTPDELIVVDQKWIYDNCLELFKHTSGCRECPYLGKSCVGRYVPQLRDLATVGQAGYRRLFSLLGRRRYNLTIGDYQYVSPMLTVPPHLTHIDAARSLRSDAKHSWEDAVLRENYENRQKTATVSAESRSFRKKACKICPIRSSCNNYKFCKGPYVDSDTAIRELLAVWKTRIAASGIPEWQLLYAGQLARHGFRAKWKRRSMVFCGVEWTGSRFRFLARRETNPQETLTFENYEDAARLFDLPRTASDNRLRPAIQDFKREVVALWFLSLNSHYSRRTRRWGGGHYPIAYRSLGDSAVEIGYYNRRCIYTWGYQSVVATLAEAHDNLYRGLNGEVRQIPIRP